MASAAMRRSYRTPGVVNGSLAYDFDTLERRLEGIAPLEPDMYTAPLVETPADVIARAREQAKEQVRAPERVSAAAVLGFAALTVMLAMLVFCYVELTAISNEVVAMQKQISTLQTEQVRLQAEYEQAFDLAGVKEAATAAGMTQPSDSQLYYIDLSAPDSAVVYSGAEQEEGFLPTLVRTFETAVEYFR